MEQNTQEIVRDDALCQIIRYCTNNLADIEQKRFGIALLLDKYGYDFLLDHDNESVETAKKFINGNREKILSPIRRMNENDKFSNEYEYAVKLKPGLHKYSDYYHFGTYWMGNRVFLEGYGAAMWDEIDDCLEVKL